jgi:hypothetical protein
VAVALGDTVLGALIRCGTNAFGGLELDELLGLIAEGVAYMEANRRLGVSFGPGLRWWAKFAPVDFPKELFNTGRTGGLRGCPAPPTPGTAGPGGRRPLSEADRAVMAVCRARGMSLREIGVLVGRHHSVVGRELARNAGGVSHGLCKGSVLKEDQDDGCDH